MLLGTPDTIARCHPNYIGTAPRWKLIADVCDSVGVEKYILNAVDPKLSGVSENAPLLKDALGSDGQPTSYTEHGYRISTGSINQINQNFKRRAVFYNYTSHTLRALIGIAFSAEPKIEIPPDLEPLRKNTDGDGTSLEQFAQDCLRENLRTGRGGIMVDYPIVEEFQSMADQEDNVPVCLVFTAAQIRDWETMRIGSKAVTCRLVLSQMKRVRTEESDSMEMILIELYLLPFRQENGVEQWAAHQRIWEKDKRGEWVSNEPTVFRGRDGNVMNRLPWVWFGSEANTHRVDFSPMRDIAELNIAHLTSSAIYEDSVYNCGQIVPWMSGLTPAQADQMRRTGFQLGSGVMLGVGSGQKFEFAQAAPNSLAKESMELKLQGMMMLGVKLVQAGQAVKTATEVKSDDLKQHSILSWCVQNVSAAVTKALGIATQYAGGEDPKFEINTSFALESPDSNLMAQLWAGIAQGKVADKDLHAYLSKVGLACPDYDEWKENLPEEPGAVEPDHEDDMMSIMKAMQNEEHDDA